MSGITAIPHHDDIASSSTASCSAWASDPCVKCDIYINHCEKDAGNFAIELCNLLQSLALQVFLDKLEFDSEEEVKSRKETAISQAAVRIPIFSPNYANWKWCLDALVNMTKSGGTIIPVFYKVEPSEVRWTGGVYAAWMLDHEKKLRYNSETIQNWRDALFQVSHISGLELQKCDGEEQDLLLKVAQSVFKDYPGLRYNVFLSHRGPDTKEIFASPLYDRLLSHGIRAFLDTRELVEGLQIAPQLELAIQFASVNIVILSPRFAESPWCLEELFLMTKSTATILPVFYEVNPSDLNGRYVEALFHHLKKQRFDADTIERWRYALADVPDLNDFVLDGNKEDLIDKIVQSVSEILSKPSKFGESYEVVQSTATCVLKENLMSSKFPAVQGDRLLSHGIRAFLDTRELVERLQIDGQLALAIKLAALHIVIFSPRFAESAWCLEELFLMIKSTAPILPVFYVVNPSTLSPLSSLQRLTVDGSKLTELTRSQLRRPLKIRNHGPMKLGQLRTGRETGRPLFPMLSAH